MTDENKPLENLIEKDEQAEPVDEKDKELTYEEAIERLELIVKKMESGKVTLDESLELFKEGSKLAAFCQKKLSENENQIKQLLDSQDGPKEVPFHA